VGNGQINSSRGVPDWETPAAVLVCGRTGFVVIMRDEGKCGERMGCGIVLAADDRDFALDVC
jgi:hypothetical protein